MSNDAFISKINQNVLREKERERERGREREGERERERERESEREREREREKERERERESERAWMRFSEVRKVSLVTSKGHGCDSSQQKLRKTARCLGMNVYSRSAHATTNTALHSSGAGGTRHSEMPTTRTFAFIVCPDPSPGRACHAQHSCPSKESVLPLFFPAQ
ncbi:hypothetical protein FHG87_010699 [Trinorchestia longiramus]|nr:hypothetical protein FHG87_010699 [Trinorchestia longiramus]